MRVGYFFSETATNLRRNLLMTIAAISTVAISLLLLGGVQILGLVVSNVTSTIESKVEINAYLFNNATPNEISDLERDLSVMPEVAGVVLDVRQAQEPAPARLGLHGLCRKQRGRRISGRPRVRSQGGSLVL